MENSNNTQQVKVRIDLPNNPKPYFNRVTSIENLVNKILDASKLMKNEDVLNLKINDTNITLKKDDIDIKNLDVLENRMQKFILNDSYKMNNEQSKTSKNLNNILNEYYENKEEPMWNFNKEIGKNVLELAVNISSKSKEVQDAAINYLYLNPPEKPQIRDYSEGANDGGEKDFEKALDEYKLQENKYNSDYNNYKQIFNNNGVNHKAIDQLNINPESVEATSFKVLLDDLTNNPKFSNLNEFKIDTNQNNNNEVIIDSRQEQLNNPEESQKVKDNIKYLQEKVKLLGFGDNDDLKNNIAKEVKGNNTDFSLSLTTDKNFFKNNTINFDLNFHRSKETGTVFLNSYQVNLHNSTKEQNKDLSYLVELKKVPLTAKESINLIEGRNVKTDLKFKDQDKESYFVKLDFTSIKDNKIQSLSKFRADLVKDTKEILKNFKIYEDQNNPTIIDKLSKSLEKGNVVPILVKNDSGKLEKLSATLFPQMNTLNLYDEKMKRVNITQSLSNGVTNEQKKTEHISQYNNSRKP